MENTNESHVAPTPFVELGNEDTQVQTGQHQTSADAQNLETMEGRQQLPDNEASQLFPHQEETQQSQKAAIAGDGQIASNIPPPITLPPAAISRKDSEAIGPSTDLPTPMLRSTTNTGPVMQFTLLLASTGTRHPYQLNERYLAKRNVQAKGSDGQFDPSAISVYTLKELILKDWRDGKP